MSDDAGAAGSSSDSDLDRVELHLRQEQEALQRAHEARQRSYEEKLARLSHLKELEKELEREKTALLAELGIERSAIRKDVPNSDGSGLVVNDVIERYVNDDHFRGLRFKTRIHYESTLKHLRQELGLERVRDLDSKRLERYYNELTEGGIKRLVGARTRLTILKVLSSFGVETLNDRDCMQLMSVLRMQMKPRMKQHAAKRKMALSAAQAIEIRLMAHKMKKRSIALAQAFQTESRIKQGDVIGRWEPEHEPGPSSDIVHAGYKWTRGIRWEHLDDNLILRHERSWDLKLVEINLRALPDVVEELKIQFPGFDGTNRDLLPNRGPIIVAERDRLPWTASEFRRKWRILARACKIPDNVWNMDSGSSEQDDSSEDDASSDKRKPTEAPDNVRLN